MTNLYSLCVCALCLGCLGLLACDDKTRGGAGESCVSADDCRSGLACVSQVCVKHSDAGTPSAVPGAGVGASCNARRDCRDGLACVANACASMSVGTDPGTRYSGRGESCQAKNDCETDLACISGMCRVVDVALERTSKSCYRVECSSKDECCAGFVPNEKCPDYKANCDMDPIFCATYRSLCECSKDCVDQQCVSSTPGCMSNGECTSTQTPYCVDGKCRQCDKDSSCEGTNTKCIAGVCMAACTTDENCPALNTCENGACMDTGCKSDRECVFLLTNPLAVCKDKECKLPCASDSECMMPSTNPAAGIFAGTAGAQSAMTKSFQICAEGECVFVGCDSDAECRALFALQNQTGGTRAVCK